MDPCGSFWWKDLIQLMPIYHGVTMVQIGNGSSSLFWKDNWNQTIYADTYPRAFSYTLIKDASVKDFPSYHQHANGLSPPSQCKPVRK